jgi:DNA-binding LacI/PurR family transcriptional regulator
VTAMAKGCDLQEMAILPEEGLPWKQFCDALDRKTAVVACSYGQATMALLMATSGGKMVGRDFALACCDELAAWKYHWPNLARAEFDRFGMGRQAAEMMLQRINKPTTRAESWVSEPNWQSGRIAAHGMQPTLPDIVRG